MAVAILTFSLDTDTDTWGFPDVSLDWTIPADEPQVTLAAATDDHGRLIVEAPADDLRFLLGHAPYAGAMAPGHTSYLAMILDYADVAPDVDDLTEVLIDTLEDLPRRRDAFLDARALWVARSEERAMLLSLLEDSDPVTYDREREAQYQEGLLYV